MVERFEAESLSNLTEVTQLISGGSGSDRLSSVSASLGASKSGREKGSACRRGGHLFYLQEFWKALL